MKPELPTDLVLPQLAHALDPLAMATTFASELDGVTVLACEVDRIKYRPQRNCSVSYRLKLDDTRSGRRLEQRVAARFCSGGDAARRHRQALARSPAASAAGPALSHFPALDMLAHWLPNDAKLDALRLLCSDSDMRQRVLPDVVAALTSGRGLLVDHDLTLVQVVPELRVCARVELRLRQVPGATVSSHTLYAKADLERSGGITQAVMRALQDSTAQAQGLLHTPQPVLWQEATGLHWQRAVPGIALQDADPAIGAASSARVGAMLAALHATAVPGLPAVRADHLRADIYRAAGLLGRVEPAWEPLLARLVAHLEAGIAALAHVPSATLHGDLHPRNVLVPNAAGEGDAPDSRALLDAADGRCTFIDLDGVHTGPAVLELGAWVADALYRATLAGMAPMAAIQATAPAWRAFLAAHAQASGHRVDPALLAWSTAQDLLCKRALRCVVNLKPGRFRAAPQLLALAEAIADAGAVDAAVDAAAVPTTAPRPATAEAA
jgi:Phosphotransferase enzyme family